MDKWGLGLCSVGLLITLLSTDATNMNWDFLSLVTGITFIVAGIVMVRKAAKKAKLKDGGKSS